MQTAIFLQGAQNPDIDIVQRLFFRHQVILGMIGVIRQ